MKSVKEQIEVIKRGSVDLISEEELSAKISRSLKSGLPLNIKFGADPTAPDLHFGHMVILRKLRDFQDLGHTVTFIIGDFTARIGDPTGVNITRRQLTKEEIAQNAQTYKKQIFKVLDEKRTDLVYNSQWLEPIKLEDVIKLAARYTVARMLERDDFSNRYKSGTPISVHEFLYPLIQGYDSVVLKADVELGGNDQKFNLLVGRELQRDYGQEPQVIMTMPILEGTDGVRKMSKSYGNYIAFEDSPADIFGKIMSIPDELITKYMLLLTPAAEKDLARYDAEMKSGALNPRDLKRELGKTMAGFFHGSGQGDKAAEEFDRIFREKQLPDSIPELSLKARYGEGESLITILADAGLVASKSEGRRLMEQGGIKIGDEKINDKDMKIIVDNLKNNPIIVKVGKRKFIKITS